MNKTNEQYICFSTRLRKFLDQNGCRWTDKGMHSVSGHPYWVFNRTRKFKELLDKYDTIK